MKRIISGLIILGICLAIFLFANKYVVDVFVSLIALMSVHELYKAFEHKNHHPIKSVGYIAAIAIAFIHVIPKGTATLFLGGIIVVSIFALFLIAILKYNKIDILDIALTFFGICYVIVFSAFLAITRELQYGNFLVWYILIASSITDTYAYFAGKTFGKITFTKVSPNKHLEGSIVGTLAAIIWGVCFTALLNTYLGTNINLVLMGAIMLVLSIMGQVGDLAASVIKRYCGIKDYSNVIPGHGGILDRIDSVIFIAPFAYYLLLLIV